MRESSDPDAASFVEIFDFIKDLRFARTPLHSLSSILMLCLCAVICRADTLMAIDGKTLRRAWDKHQGGEFVHMVSAWANSNRMVLK